MLKKIEIIARVGIFGTFLGHGIVALVSTKWVYLLTAYGFSDSTAKSLLPVIGCLDILIAFSVLIYPLRVVLVWAASWAFMAALSRCIAGDPIYEFVERSANWSLPLILLLVKNHQLQTVRNSNLVSKTVTSDDNLEENYCISQ